MPPNQLTSFITTASGFAGGMTRALIGRGTLTAITLNSLIEVALYAGTSALVGYGVKLGIDCLKKLYMRCKKNGCRTLISNGQIQSSLQEIMVFVCNYVC